MPWDAAIDKEWTLKLKATGDSKEVTQVVKVVAAPTQMTMLIGAIVPFGVFIVLTLIFTLLA